MGEEKSKWLLHNLCYCIKRIVDVLRDAQDNLRSWNAQLAIEFAEFYDTQIVITVLKITIILHIETF